ncbi:hypothetical protein TNCV_4157511 [Trichonephila clavipes]|nr:hypothetical protein TNCV_4157511 [Trichonephila clavipes]
MAVAANLKSRNSKDRVALGFFGLYYSAAGNHNALRVLAYHASTCSSCFGCGTDIWFDKLHTCYSVWRTGNRVHKNSSWAVGTCSI